MATELRPCICGTLPEFKSEAGMIDFLKCPNCGIEGSPFYDGASEWLISDWNAGKRKKR